MVRSVLRGLSAAVVLTAASGIVASASLAAQASAPLPPAAAAPTRVGRIAAISGSALFRARGAAWAAAETNLPLAAGDALRTDAQSRAEIRIAPQTLDLAKGSTVILDRLDRHAIALGLPQGRLYLHLRSLDPGESAEIDIPRGAVWLSAPGKYEIASGTAGAPSQVTVLQGSARFAGPGATATIAAGESAAIAGAKPVTTGLTKAAADDLDKWGEAADYRQKQLGPSFVSPGMTGRAALTGHGKWTNTAPYGPVWYPQDVPANWAPYRFGHWQRIAPWGWTWIDAEPWGFAPSHYGRWALIGKVWAWVPGRFVAHPAFVPAAVAFLGTPGVGLSVAGSSIPAIGWFPLAPGEIYWPSYSRNLAYARRLNRGDVADLAAVSPNPDGSPPVEIVTGSFALREAATVIPRPEFVAGQPVASALLTLPGERLRNAPVITGSPRLGPAASPRPVIAVAQTATPAAKSPASKMTGRTAAAAKIQRPAAKPAPHRVAAAHPVQRPPAKPAPHHVAAAHPVQRPRAKPAPHRVAAAHPVRHRVVAHFRAPPAARHIRVAPRHLVAYHPRRIIRHIRRR